MSDVFRDRLFEGRTAVFTGGGSGINLRVAERFAEQGAHVALIGRTKEKLDAAVAAIVGKGGSASAHPCDVRDYKGLEAVMTEVHAARGEIDVLVSGAAGNFPAPAAVMSANGFKAVMDIDVLGTFNAARSAFERLRKPGSIVINISAPQAFIPYPMQSHVCAAKAGVDMLTKTLALEWGQFGVRVVKGEAAGYAYTEDLSWDALVRAAETAAQIAQGADVQLVDVAGKEIPSRYPVVTPSLLVSGLDKRELLLRADRAARAEDPKITRVEASIAESYREVVIATSAGVYVRDVQPMLRFGIRVIAEHNGKRQAGSSGGGGRVGMEYFRCV